MRKVLAILFILTALLIVAQTTLAKGPADMVTVSGGGLDAEFSTTRADIVLNLSLGYFESNCSESVGDTALLGEGYTVERYYQISDGSFHLFDQLVYYPRTDQQGIINIANFADPVSGYANDWTCVSEQGEQAFQLLLAQAQTQPYLMLAGDDGILRIADPQSLEQIAQIDLAAASPSHIRSGAGGTALHYQSQTDTETQEYILDLANQTRCSREAVSSGDQQVIASSDGRWRALIDLQSSNTTAVDLQYMQWENNNLRLPYENSATYSGAWDTTSSVRFYLTDGASIYRFDPMNEGRMRENVLALPDAASESAQLEMAGVIQDRAYLYYPGTNDAALGGIFVVNVLTGDQINRIQQELSFAQVLLTDDGLYAVGTPTGADETSIYSLDRMDGSIVTEQTIGTPVSNAAYDSLNPGLLSLTTRTVSVSNCPDTASLFVALPDPFAALPPN